MTQPTPFHRELHHAQVKATLMAQRNAAREEADNAIRSRDRVRVAAWFWAGFSVAALAFIAFLRYGGFAR